MSNWKARLPKEAPPRGQAHVVYAWKSGGGFRSERFGTVSLQKARLIERVMAMDDLELSPTYESLSISATIRQKKVSDGNQENGE